MLAPMRRLALLLALLAVPLTTPLAAQDVPALHAVTGVAPDDVLNLREAPTASAEAVGSLPPDATDVEVVAVSPDGLWGLVALPEGGGWARLSFLRVTGAPAPRTVPARLTCQGTEPFWTVSLDGAGDRWSTPEEDRPLRRIGQAAGFGGFVVAFDRDGATLDLTVTRASCSDGMSDRPYGFRALVWDRGGQLLEGCCSLR